MPVTNDIWGYLLLCIMSFLTISNPLGIMPFYISLTAGMSQPLKLRIIKRSIIAATIALLLFSFLGPMLFKLFGVSVEGFRIIGGIIFFNLGYGMLNDTGSRRNTKLVKQHENSDHSDAEGDNISIIPLAIPILCGPGLMTNGIILRQEASSPAHIAILAGCIIIFYLAVGLVLKLSEKITEVLGETGTKVLSRIMGLILMVIAAEFIIAGIKPILSEVISTAIK